MDNNRETTGAKRKREADISSTSEGYISTESSEYDISEDGSDDEFTSDRKYKTTLVESEFLPDDGINRALNIEILISPRVWRDNITAQCTHEGKAIGREIEKVVWMIFNRYGFLKEKFKSYPVHRGTGVWGSELDDGPLLLIEEVYITDAEWRRKGVGSAMVRQLLVVGEKCVNSAKPMDMSPGLIALEFGSLIEDVQPQYVGKSKRQKLEINLRAINTAVSFYRFLGFRCIGSSPCFAYSFNPNHRAQSIAPDMDFGPQMELLDDREEETGMGDYIIPYGVEVQLRERTLSAMRKEFPLHHAATTLPDLECMEYLKKATAEDEINLTIVDRTHKTLLHTLARRLKPERIRWLLAHVNAASSWKSARDINGDSPLDVLKDFLEDMRTKRLVFMGNPDVSDDFRRYPPTAVECLSLLDDTLSPDLSVSHLKYGCTCGQSEILYDMLSYGIDDGQTWVEWNDSRLENVAYDVQQNFKTNKSICQGYTNIFSRVCDCLQSNLAPSVEKILQAVEQWNEWPPVTRNYLTRAGDLRGIRAAVTCILDEAHSMDDRTGNGE
ncbi:hypothetical protein BDV33DRAFT_188357 [Aspergillus novoparasiticus]|uniref:Uncharacterized protein n=1 Tax=Aspergillus novoparasiticus TaxID=986946 RepID=A0A5N6F484_9EURO|nr:hypothetical protein BDV33DRAFT_188357 [Aspergillus novoparasiticus]